MPIPKISKKTRSPQGWKDRRSPGSYSIKNTIEESRRARKKGGVKKYKKKRNRNPGPNFIFLILLVILAGSLLSAIYIAWLSKDLPEPNKLIDRAIAESTKIYDRTGENTLYEIHGAEKRTIIKLEEIPKYVKWATITAEDRKFYEHSGFNLLAIFKGVVIDPLTGKRMRGGSTLTQQLVKNAILTNERKISRKVKEFVLSYRIEKKFSKDEILQMYFNEIPYGSTAYGIEAAAARYFGVSAEDLSLAQAAVLAALPKAPSYYSPYGTHKDRLMARQQYILEEMEKEGYISEEDKDLAIGQELEFKDPVENITAPHFVMYIKELLGGKYGEQTIEQEGLKIYTTLDLYKQEIAEEVVEKWSEINERDYKATNASLISIDPKTGQILAMVGSRDYFNEDIDGQVNVALRLRQPGSSLKPIVYAAAFKKGYTPNTILYDVATNFAVEGSEKSYEPHNYDLKEHGPVTIRKALAGSLNIPAVKALYLTGVENVTDLAQEMGYSSLNEPERYGLSLVLGGGEVRLLDHTAAYGIFAREGEYYPPAAILKIEDRNGEVLEEWEEDEIKPKKVIDKKIVRLINDILSDNSARTYAFGANNWLTLKNRPAAAKTGTTNDYRDAWTIGYTPSLAAGVWVGNNDNTEMKRGAAGGAVAAPIWHDYMQRVLGNTPVEQFNKPETEPTGKTVLDGSDEGKIKVKIDKISGFLATEHTPQELIEEKEYVQAHSILYYCDKDNPRGEIPKDKNYDPQFQIWEDAIKKWAEENDLSLDMAPTKYDNIHKPEYVPKVTVHSPEKNSVIMEPRLKVDISPEAPQGIGRAEYYIDGHLIGLVDSYPYSLSHNINFLTNGNHTLTIKVCDVVENCWKEERQFNLILEEAQQDFSLNLSWSLPSSNSNVSKKDFPLKLKVLTFKPDTIKEINFYSLKDNGTTPNLIASAKNVVDNEIVSFWQEPPEQGGSYKLYAEAAGWAGNFMSTNEVEINIKE